LGHRRTSSGKPLQSDREIAMPESLLTQGGRPVQAMLVPRGSGGGVAVPEVEAEAQEERRLRLGPLSMPLRTARSSALCLVYVLLSASGPILLDWVKRSHGGRFRFSIPALTFNAWAIAAFLGFCWTFLTYGRSGLRRLYRPDMLWRFCITTGLFTAGDMLSFMSMQHLDVGTFSLLGKSSALIITMVLSRLLLNKPHTRLQYVLVVIVATATVIFCLEEQGARSLVAARAASRVSSAGEAAALATSASEWMVGLIQRASAVAMTSLGAVLQEQLFTRERGLPFMMQQCWMGCGAMLMSFFTLRCIYGLPASYLVEGFGDWRVLVLVGMYVATGMTTGLIVKQLGAVAKALCVPVYLGGCYAYAVRSGSAMLTLPVILAWSASTVCVLLFAVSKAAQSKGRAA